MSMTPERLAEIEKRVLAAAEGPWKVDPNPMADYCPDCEDYPCEHTGQLLEQCSMFDVAGPSKVGDGECSWLTKNDAAFIAHARQDVPDLLEEVRRLKGIIAADDERLREAGQRVDIDMGCDTAHWMANAIEGLRESIEATRNEVASVLMLMDGLAEVWGDEGVFRTCRDRLRKLVQNGERE